MNKTYRLPRHAREHQIQVHGVKDANAAHARVAAPITDPTPDDRQGPEAPALSSVAGSAPEPKRPTPSERLNAFGWSRPESREFAETFGRVKAPYHGSPPGQKQYRQRKLRLPEGEYYVRFESHVGRKHLLGEEQVAARPPQMAVNLRFDFDNEEEFRFFLTRLSSDRLRIGWMAELSPGGGGHVEICVQRKRAKDWQIVSERLLVALRVFDPKDPTFKAKMSDCVRVKTDKVLRLPFFQGRVVLFSDGAQIEIHDPGCAKAAWERYKELPRHTFNKFESILKNPPKVPGRPRKYTLMGSLQDGSSSAASQAASASRSSHSLDRAIDPVDPNASLSLIDPNTPHPIPLPYIYLYTKGIGTDQIIPQPIEGQSLSSNPPGSSVSGGLPGKRPEVIDGVLARVGSTRGQRFTNGSRVIGLLLNAGYPATQLLEAALEVFRRTGSKDAAQRPDAVREWLRDIVIPWVLKEREQTGSRWRDPARSSDSGSAA